MEEKIYLSRTKIKPLDVTEPVNDVFSEGTKVIIKTNNNAVVDRYKTLMKDKPTTFRCYYYDSDPSVYYLEFSKKTLKTKMEMKNILTQD